MHGKSTCEARPAARLRAAKIQKSLRICWKNEAYTLVISKCLQSSSKEIWSHVNHTIIIIIIITISSSSSSEQLGSERIPEV